jgi:arginase family enzyme
MGRAIVGQRLQVNPYLRRVPGSATHAFVQTDPSRVFELTPDTFTLLAEFTTPRTIEEVIGELREPGDPDDPDDPVAAIFAQLCELRILVPIGGELGPRPLRRTPPTVPLCGAPTWPEDQAEPGAVVVLGARFDDHTLPDYARGAAAGPTAIRHASAAYPLRERLEDGRSLGLFDIDAGRRLLAGARVHDAGDLCGFPGCTWDEYAGALATELRAIAARGGRTLLLGGDHSVSLPALLARTDPFVLLHIDAHTDAAPLRYRGDLHHGNFLRHAALGGNLRQIVNLGVRGFQDIPPDIEGVPYLARSPLQLRSLGDDTLVGLLAPDLPVYVSVDIDALDPAVAPATPAQEPGGFTLSELRRLLRVCLAGRQVVGADLVEVQGDRDGSTLTARAALLLVVDLMDMLAP